LYLVANAGDYDSEFTAYLVLSYLRSRIKGAAEPMLIHETMAGRSVSRIVLHLDNDVLTAVPQLHRWQRAGYIGSFTWGFVNDTELGRRRQQTQVFQAAYSLPAKLRLEQIPRATLVHYVRRFIRFKSMTDPRVRGKMEPVPQVLSANEADQLAGDIITVAEFFDLPLDLFLGIGAMENNYMNVRGDLENKRWKRRAEPGDIVLRRVRGRVLVKNDSAGVWQITRETLRYAHRLYLKDQRDYCLLPYHLQPPVELDINSVPPKSLTTYAGILFRDLLDQFGGDAARAVGAYNGGPANPNERYEAGVRLVAGYAREVLERAATLDGQAIPKMQFLRSGN
jgi:hypothetical protein